MIECKRLSFTYNKSGHKILDGLSFTIQGTQNYFIDGEHGVGKSTLIKLLASEKFSFVDGYVEGDVLHFVPQNRILFFDSQDIELFFYDLVYDEFYYTLRSLGYPKGNILSQIPIIMSYFQIEHWSHRSISELSIGEKQYLKLILSIATKQYNLMLFDEPFLHLDQAHKMFILQYLEQIQEDYGTTFVVVDHDQSLWKKYFHFERIQLSKSFEYKPWFISSNNASIEGFEARQVDFSNAPLQGINHLQLTIAPKKDILLLGKNGAGKTTICKYLMKLYPGSPELRMSKKMLMDRSKFMFLYSSLENEWGDIADIQHPYGHMHPQHLSDGQNKIEMFQRLVADRPQLLILDDPYDGLNAQYRTYIYEQIQNLKNAGSCVVLTGTDRDDEKEHDEIIEL